MAETTLVDEIRAVLEKVRGERGSFTLAMLYNSFENGEIGWNLIASAPWSDGLPTADAVRFWAETLQAGLSQANKKLISRVTVLPSEDGFVQAMNRAFELGSPGSTVQISNSVFFGINIPRGVLFYSHREVPAHR